MPNKVVIFRCMNCQAKYIAEQLNYGHIPKEIHCHECEGTAELHFREYHEVNLKTDYILVSPSWNNQDKYRRTEANWYKRYGFSDVECALLFDYEIRWIKAGGLVLIKK